jgi:hypothetical protein
VNWYGQVTGTVSGSSFNGQLAFTGTTSSQTVCTGVASIVGSVKSNTSSATLSLTSSAGVVGGPCPAALPIDIAIELRR